MTKTLSQLLGAKEPDFQLGLRQLERAAGGAAEDVRLTHDILQGRRACLRDLGLDPDDTTARELYAALMQRVKDDNETFEQLLGVVPDGANAMPQVERLVRTLQVPMQVFGLRQTVSKRLLRQHPPKKALKQLGYRSIDSVLKHEPCPLLFAAAALAEGPAWHKAIQAAYRKLGPGDFELRQVQIVAPDDERWERVSRAFVARSRHNIISFRELGAIVLLPLPGHAVPAAPLAATLLVLQAINDIRAASTYLKLHIVRPDFGDTVARIARSEPMTKAEVAGAVLPWKLVHRYFARHPDAYNGDLFAPHVHPEDLQWHAAESALAGLHPRFGFWQSASYAGLLEKGEMVSLNLMDSVLNFCNRRPYEQRLVRYARGQLWHELMLRYMRQSGIERTVHDQLGRELVDAETFA